MKTFVHQVDQLMYQGKRTEKTGFVLSYNLKNSSSGNLHFDSISKAEEHKVLYVKGYFICLVMARCSPSAKMERVNT
jgi:hypothetical protein